MPPSDNRTTNSGMFLALCIKSLTHRRISDLIAELELFGIISSKVVSKGRYGRTRVISLSLSDELKVKVQTILKESFG